MTRPRRCVQHLAPVTLEADPDVPVVACWGNGYRQFVVTVAAAVQTAARITAALEEVYADTELRRDVRDLRRALDRLARRLGLVERRV
jgi:hypothetical protein